MLGNLQLMSWRCGCNKICSEVYIRYVDIWMQLGVKVQTPQDLEMKMKTKQWRIDILTLEVFWEFLFAFLKTNVLSFFVTRPDNPNKLFICLFVSLFPKFFFFLNFLSCLPWKTSQNLKIFPKNYKILLSTSCFVPLSWVFILRLLFIPSKTTTYSFLMHHFPRKPF